MYAVIRTGGKQERVAEGQTLRVELLGEAPGAEVSFTPVLVVDGETGLLVPLRDEPAFARGVTALLEDEPRRARMGSAARAMAEDRFDARRWAGRLYQVYEQAARVGRVRP